MNEELERKEIEYARGKTAANDVRPAEKMGYTPYPHT